MLLSYFISHLILVSFVNINSSIMCYSKLNNVFPNAQSLFDPSSLTEIEDNCDYLDIESCMLLERDPNFLTLIQLNVRGMIGKLASLSHLAKNVGQAQINALLLCETWLNQVNSPRQ